MEKRGDLVSLLDSKDVEVVSYRYSSYSRNGSRDIKINSNSYKVRVGEQNQVQRVVFMIK